LSIAAGGRGPNTAIIWQHGAPTVIATGASVRGVNDLSAVVGNVGTPSGAYVWRNGSLEMLPSVGAQTVTSAGGVHDLGQIVGAVQSFAGGPQTAVIWDRSGGRDLNGLVAADDPLRPYITLTSAIAINNLGQIVSSGNDSRSGTVGGYYLLTPVRPSGNS